MNVAIGELKQAGSTSDVAITATDSAGKKIPGIVTFFIKVVSGTIKFGIGSTHASAHGWAAGDVHPITCMNGELYIKAAATTDTFVITTC